MAQNLGSVLLFCKSGIEKERERDKREGIIKLFVRNLSVPHFPNTKSDRCSYGHSAACPLL